MSFTPVTVTKTWTNPDGSHATGTVTFALSQQMTDSSTGNSVDAEDVTAILVLGAISQSLIANTDPTTVPTSTVYSVTENVSSEPNPVSYSIVIPHGAMGGTATLQSCIT